MENILKGNVSKAFLFVFIFLLLSVISGCKTKIDQSIDEMVKPVIVAAISENGTVLLRGADGKILTIPNTYYAAQAISGSIGVGEIVIPLPDK